MRSEPDLLITLNGANDLVTASKTLRPGIAYADDFIRMGVEQPVLNGMLGLIRNSQFINCVNKLRERKVEGQAHGNDALLADTLDHCEDALRSMATIAKGLDIPHYMFLQPYIHLRKNLGEEERAMAEAYAYRGDYTTKGFEALRERLPQAEFPPNALFIDATTAFDTVDAPCFIDEVHLTEAGNEALIAFMAQSIAGARDRWPSEGNRSAVEQASLPGKLTP
jgi:lysophospholipase L1-like esterase